MASDHDADATVQRVFAETFIRTEIIDLVLAALKPGDRLPGGLVVVPEEMSRRMYEAAESVMCITDYCDCDHVEIYAAMLRAASGDT